MPKTTESNSTTLSTFTTTIIGNSTLSIQCAELLIENKHHIDGIVTSDPAVEKWANAAAIRSLFFREEEGLENDALYTFLSQRPFDYLFSIDNPLILQADVLSLPNSFAINYHDALLPKYGGLNATSWAIYNQEKQHGISWHIVENKVDAGDILKQWHVELTDQETALSLNAKCYEGAIVAFKELIGELATSTFERKPQNLQDCSFYYGYQRPTPACIIDWYQPADQIIALTQSLTFGSYANPLGMPKIAINAGFVLTNSFQKLESKSTSAPGTVITIGDEQIVISTADYDVAVSDFTDENGRLPTVSQLQKGFGFSAGDHLPTLSPDTSKQIHAFTKKIHKYEPYWVKRVSSLTPIELPYIDVTSNPTQVDHFEQSALEIPEAITNAFQSKIKDQSFGDYLATAFAIYLSRLTGTRTFDLGFQSAELGEAFSDRQMQGLFSPYVPLHVRLDGEQSVDNGREAVKQQILACKQRKTFTRDLMARYPELKGGADIDKSLNVRIEVSRNRAKLALATFNDGAELILSVPENVTPNGRTGIIWHYRPSQIRRENMLDMHRQFLILLQHSLENPSSIIQELPILSEAERQQILVDWNPQFGDYPQGEFFHQLVETQVKRVPNHTAVVYEDQRLTYRELDARANQLAHILHGMGVGPETYVGIFLERSVDMIAGILGILKAGGTYVPMNTSDPEDRLAFILEDTGLQVLVTQESLCGRLSAPSLQKLCLDPGWYDPDTEYSGRYDSGLTIENLAYIIYTSGSTGRPKGVMMSHRSLVNRFYWEMDEFDQDESDVFLQQFSISFDYSVWEIFTALITGASLILTKPHGHTDRVYLTQLIKEQGITITGFVPAMLESILDETDLSTISSLRQVTTGGEELTVELQQKYFDRMSAELTNGYGPTEACIDATYWVCRPDFDHPRIPIGRPLANSKVYLLDDHLQLVPPGVPGEICIAGISLARGYLNRPDLTAEKFIPNPFGLEPDERIYRTGDLAYHLPDGNIVFVGRKDNQIQLRGHRVELSEIQLAIDAHPAVRRSVVVAHGETHLSKQIVAYVKLHEEQRITNRELRESLTRLPDYMLPSTIVLIDEIPLTNNGKVDHKKLPAPTQENRLTDQVSVQPRTEDEAIIAEIWQDVLGLKSLGIHDDFFALGGNSLMITQIVSRLRERLNFELPIHELFQAPTVAELALKKESLLAQDTGSGDSDSLSFTSATTIKSTGKLANREARIPLSFAQQGLWFLDQLETDNVAYNIPQAYRLTGELNVDALQKSLTAVVTRHETLRTNFVLDGSEPVQLIHPPAPFELPIVDLTGSLKPEQETADLIQQTNDTPFDLAHDLMLRARLYKLSDREFILALFTHHIAYDGWSDGVIWEELTETYTAYCNGETADLPELPIQYADYCIWQRERFQDANISEHLDFWRGQLTGAETLQLPTDFSRPPRLTYHGRAVPFKLSKKVTAQLNGIARRNNSTLFMTLLATFKLLLSRYTGQIDITIGTSIANRTLSEIEPLIGFFINTLVVRSQLDNESSFETLLHQVRQTLLSSYKHQTLPFERVVEEIQPARDLSQNPIFQVLFVLQNTPQYEFQLPNLEQKFWPLEHKSIHIDLECEFYEHDGMLHGELVYNTALFAQETIEQMAVHYGNLLEAIGAGDSRPIAHLPLLSAQEEDKILKSWNDTGVPVPEQSLSELFVAQATKTPDRTALIFGDETVSYGDLAQRTAQLMAVMQARGVKLGDRVGVALERSPNVTVALLAILQIGATYVPLDPAYPAERLQWMADDAQLSLLITNERYAHMFSATKHLLFCIDSLVWELPSGQVKIDLTPNPVSGIPTYILYTSGSTGRPKGVVGLEHGILNRLHWMWREFPFQDGAVSCQKTSLNFVDSIWELFGSLLKGVPTVIVPEPMVKDPPAFIDLLAKHAVSRLVVVPSLLTLLLDLDEKLDEHLPSLKMWVSSGERLPADLCRRFHAQLPGRTLLNLYGSTEVAADVTVYDTSNLGSEQQVVPIGRPIDNSQLYIVSADQRLADDLQPVPVPVGVTGELVIGGAGVSAGYWGQEKLTNERFISNKIGEPRTLFRTGDLARYLPDGTIELQGRNDQQLKINGNRVEPAEVERALLSHPNIESAYLQAEGDDHSKQLVGYIAVEPELDSQSIRSHLSTKLPSYMIPTRFVQLDQLPRLPNGKIDRQTLQQADKLTVIKQDNPADMTLTEQLLQEIWEDVLNVSPIGLHDNFFDLGGHSLLGIRLFVEIEKRLGIRLPAATLFQAPTISEMSHQLHSQDEASPWDTLSPIQPDGDKLPFFCVHGFGGGVLDYKNLADQLDSDRPFIGIRAVGRGDGQAPHESVEEMATHYVQAMQAMQPTGPYHLGGYCFGGIVAYEMARQLQAKGEMVGLLAIFEGYAIGYDEAWQQFFRPRAMRNFLVNLPHWLRAAVEQGSLRNRVSSLFHQAADEKQLSEIRDWASADAVDAVQQLIDQDASLLPPSHRQVILTHSEAIAIYDPQPYAGKIDLFRVKAMSALRATDPTMGWGSLASEGVDMHKIDGAHFNILEKPHVGSLAKQLQACLD